MTEQYRASPFAPLTPEEEVYERHRCRFLGVPFEPEVNHRCRCWAAFKKWEWGLRHKTESIRPLLVAATHIDAPDRANTNRSSRSVLAKL